MKALLLLLAICSLQTVFAQVRYITLFANDTVDLNPTDIVEIVGTNHTSNVGVTFTRADGLGSTFISFNTNSGSSNTNYQNKSHIFTGLKSAAAGLNSVITLKITPFLAANTTVSKPVIVPPSSASTDKWNVQLQVSTDLKNWEDVVSGEFLGSDKARFFRIKTTTGNAE
ncbi:hypothetical protein N9Z03_02245 [Akkermansiaceae bacterium]|nr:hypothetical protein [Akkermansiaceae bacterium]